MSLEMFNELSFATYQTFLMVLLSGLLGTLFGLPLGVALSLTRPNGILKRPSVYSSLATLVNMTRSIPFIILLIILVPITRFIVGTSIGTAAAIVPLTIGAIPFIARIVENALNEVHYGLIEAGLAMGATNIQIVLKILIPESRIAIIKGLTVVLISLIGYSAMAGAVGGGGLGDLAIRYGYQRFDIKIMLITLVILILLTQIMQFFGDKIAQRMSHKHH